MTTMRVARLVALVVLCAALAANASANPRSQALCREGYDAVYNLDHDRAVELFRQAIAADPNDPAAYRGAAGADWLRVLFLRGTVLAEDFLGRVSASAEIKLPPPPPALDAAFRQNIQRAIALGENGVSRRYNQAAAHYDLGAALGISASYTGTVEGHVFTGMRLARRAFAENEYALQLDPRRKDAGLAPGLYRYLISTLPLPVRLMAYIVGFAGDGEKAIKLVEDAAAYPSDVQADARIALILIYNRERRYDDALQITRILERSYPENRLFILEEASTALRAGKVREAEVRLDEAIARLPQDRRVRMAGEQARWHYQRGMARLRLGKLNEAEQDLRTALGCTDVRTWVQSRIRVELGKVWDLRGDRSKARGEYETALSLARLANDSMAEADASRLLAQPYRQ